MASDRDRVAARGSTVQPWPGSGASSPAARVLVRDGVQAVSRKFLDLGGQHLGLKIKVRGRGV